MAGIAGLLGYNDTDIVYVNTIGQEAVYQQISGPWVQRVNADMAAALGVFVEDTTENVKERYYLPGGGRLDRRGLQARTSAAKATGSWDVSYKLEDFGNEIGGNDVDLSYMTLPMLQRALDTIEIRNTNTVRFEMLKAIFNGAAGTFLDKIFGSQTYQGLANGDAITYPPVLGSESEATDNHYLESNYAYTAIDATHNPIPTMVSELVEHFGEQTGGEEVVVFCNRQEEPYLTALTGFNEVSDRFIQMGANANMPVNLPRVPGVILGRGYGAWLVRWPWIPAGWMFALHLGVPAPLKMRVDIAQTGLPRGLSLVARDTKYPLQYSEWRHRFGFGVGNRLNGCVMELGTGGTYTVPTDYA